MTKSGEIRILLAGCGPHGRRFYLPSIERLRERFGLRICCVVELPSVTKRLKQDVRWPGNSIPEIIDSPSLGGPCLPPDFQAILDQIVEQQRINAVIICTDPPNHRSYARWALDRGLHVMMDKPVSTRPGVIHNADAAEGLIDDYDALMKRPDGESGGAESPIFSLCVHRRYHPGIAAVEEIITDVSSRTGCPLTHYHAYHSDGQWRLPGEMITQSHHSYFDGHGKLSHSGFHFMDCIVRMRRAAAHASGKSADQARISATFVQPDGLLHQLGEAEYLKLFGEGYARVSPGPDSELATRFSRYGEIDLDALISFESGGVPVGTVNLSLLHNGFSRRAWLEPGADLYKGNGRVKHEEHRIQIGPFASIHVLSWQAKDKHEVSEPESDSLPGGNNHFDIHVFRNSGMVGGKPYECIRLSDLAACAKYDPERLLIEQIKEEAVVEFFRAIRSEIPRDELKSPFSLHRDAVRLMAAIYSANIRAAGSLGPGHAIPWNDLQTSIADSSS